MIVTIDDVGDHVCEHGTALDVHCCNCHSGFIFDYQHECPEAAAEALAPLVPTKEDVQQHDDDHTRGVTQADATVSSPPHRNEGDS